MRKRVSERKWSAYTVGCSRKWSATYLNALILITFAVRVRAFDRRILNV